MIAGLQGQSQTGGIDPCDAVEVRFGSRVIQQAGLVLGEQELHSIFQDEWIIQHPIGQRAKSDERKASVHRDDCQAVGDAMVDRSDEQVGVLRVSEIGRVATNVVEHVSTNAESSSTDLAPHGVEERTQFTNGLQVGVIIARSLGRYMAEGETDVILSSAKRAMDVEQT